MKYTANSLEDIARVFDTLAREQQKRRQKGGFMTKVELSRLAGEQFAYTDCASILRNTTMPCEVASVKAIQDALGTGEDGAALVEVARNAHSAEQELAGLKRVMEGDDWRERAVATLAQGLITAVRWGNANFLQDVLDDSVTVSDDSPIGIVRRALSIAKQLRG